MATAALLRSLCCRDVATASLSAYLSLNSTVKSSLQGHHWVSLARPFSCIPVWNDVKGIDSVTTSSSVAEMEKKLGFEIRKHAEMVIWNIRMIKRYKTKIPGEIVKRIEDEVLDLRKASRGKSVFREPKSKMDENLACRNDSVVWGSHGDQFSDDEQDGGYFGGEASWDQSGSDIPIMNKILEEHRDKIPSDLAREVEAAIIDLQKATEGGNADEINAKLDDASKAVSKIGEHMYRGPDSDDDSVGDHDPAGCLNDGEYHEGEASKNDPEAFGGGSNTHGGGFDNFDNHYDSCGGGDYSCGGGELVITD